MVRYHRNRSPHKQFSIGTLPMLFGLGDARDPVWKCAIGCQRCAAGSDVSVEVVDEGSVPSSGTTADIVTKASGY